MFDPAATARLFIDYQIGTFQRVAQFRFAVGSQAAAATDSLGDLLTANVARFGDNVSFLGARVAEQGSNVSNPVGWDVITGTGTSIATRDTPRFYSWYGRSISGVKTRWYWYGLSPASVNPGDYRLTGEEDANIAAFSDDFVSWLEELEVLTVDGNVPVVANYVNVGYNAYHQRKLRG